MAHEGCRNRQGPSASLIALTAASTRPSREALGQRDGIWMGAAAREKCQHHRSQARAVARARPHQLAPHARQKAGGMGYECRRRHTNDAASGTAKRETEHVRGYVNTSSTQGTRPTGWDMNVGSGTRRMPAQSHPSASLSTRAATLRCPAREAQGQRDVIRIDAAAARERGCSQQSQARA